MRQSPQSGFTLIEILVVVAIIGLISSTVFISLAAARTKGRDARRKADLVQLQTALEIYLNYNGTYPNTGGSWHAVAGTCGGSFDFDGPDGYIPNLAPTYMGILPDDPKPSTDVCSGYNYRSDGVNYKLISNAVSGTGGPETFPTASDTFYDAARPTTAWMVTNNPAATNTCPSDTTCW